MALYSINSRQCRFFQLVLDKGGGIDKRMCQKSQPSALVNHVNHLNHIRYKHTGQPLWVSGIRYDGAIHMKNHRPPLLFTIHYLLPIVHCSLLTIHRQLQNTSFPHTVFSNTCLQSAKHKPWEPYAVPANCKITRCRNRFCAGLAGCSI